MADIITSQFVALVLYCMVLKEKGQTIEQITEFIHKQMEIW